MKIEEKLELLSSIQRVEAPQFLISRIQEKIRKKIDDKISSGSLLSYCTILLFLLLVNFAAIRFTHSEGNSKLGLNKTYELNSNNYFYNE